MAIIKNILRKIYILFNSQRCLLCKQSSVDLVCMYCKESVLDDVINYSQNIDVGEKLVNHYAMIRYTNSLKFLLHKLKFSHDVRVVNILVDIMCIWWQNNSSNFKDVELILPVPIHPKRYRLRGFNQNEVVIKEFAKRININYSFENLSREKYTKAQSESTKAERQSQIKGVFCMKKKLVAEHIVLFDDIFTTGATLKELYQAIDKDDKSKVKEISLLTLVRA